MKSIAILAAAATAIFLAACSTVPNTPKLNQDQKESKLRSTLKVYDDNAVALKFSDARGKAVAWAWSRGHEVTALEMAGHLYNAKDIESITVKPRSKEYEYDFTVQFRDGRQQAMFANSLSRGDAPGPSWYECGIKQEHCLYRQLATAANGNMYFFFVTEGMLENATTTLPLVLGDGGGADGERKMPAISGFAKTEVLNDVESKKLMERVQNVVAARAGRSKAIADERERVAAAKAKKIADETAQLRKTARIGSETNCGTIFDMRLPLVGVQTMIGQQYLRLDSLYGPSTTCRFSNGQYVGQ